MNLLDKYDFSSSQLQISDEYLEYNNSQESYCCRVNNPENQNQNQNQHITNPFHTNTFRNNQYNDEDDDLLPQRPTLMRFPSNINPNLAANTNIDNSSKVCTHTIHRNQMYTHLFIHAYIYIYIYIYISNRI